MQNQESPLYAINLKGTPAERDYKGCGWGVLVVRSGLPQLLIYLPDDL